MEQPFLIFRHMLGQFANHYYDIPNLTVEGDFPLNEITTFTDPEHIPLLQEVHHLAKTIASWQSPPSLFRQQHDVHLQNVRHFRKHKEPLEAQYTFNDCVGLMLLSVDWSALRTKDEILAQAAPESQLWTIRPATFAPLGYSQRISSGLDLLLPQLRDAAITFTGYELLENLAEGQPATEELMEMTRQFLRDQSLIHAGLKVVA